MLIHHVPIVQLHHNQVCYFLAHVGVSKWHTPPGDSVSSKSWAQDQYKICSFWFHDPSKNSWTNSTQRHWTPEKAMEHMEHHGTCWRHFICSLPISTIPTAFNGCWRLLPIVETTGGMSWDWLSSHPGWRSIGRFITVTVHCYPVSLGNGKHSPAINYGEGQPAILISDVHQQWVPGKLLLLTTPGQEQQLRWRGKCWGCPETSIEFRSPGLSGGQSLDNAAAKPMGIRCPSTGVPRNGSTWSMWAPKQLGVS